MVLTIMRVHNFCGTAVVQNTDGKVIIMNIIMNVYISYSESRERPIQTIMKVSSKSLNYLPIFFSNSMVDRKVDS